MYANGIYVEVSPSTANSAEWTLSERGGPLPSPSSYSGPPSEGGAPGGSQ